MQVVASNLSGDRLNVRAGPGTIYIVVDTVIEGEAMLITSDTSSAEGYRWWPVELVDNTVGWVAEGSADGSETWLVPLDRSFPNPLRSLARSVQRAIADRDSAFFWDAAEKQLILCPAGWDVYACKDQPDGTYVDGLGVVNPFEGTLYGRTQYENLLAGWFATPDLGVSDAYGDGALAIHAIAMSTTPGSDRYHIIVSAIRSSVSGEQWRDVLVLNWRLIDGEWRHTGLYRSEGFWEEGGTPPVAWLTDGCGIVGCTFYERWR